jgi:hypothetical protein
MCPIGPIVSPQDSAADASVADDDAGADLGVPPLVEDVAVPEMTTHWPGRASVIFRHLWTVTPAHRIGASSKWSAAQCQELAPGGGKKVREQLQRVR